MSHTVKSPHNIAGFFLPILAECANEHCIAVYLMDSEDVSGISYFPGDISSIILPVRRIVQDAFLYSADRVILIHNHPSGKAEPSDADRLFTRKCERVLTEIEVELVDHIIIARDKWVSFRMLGLL
jgi:DNA repair protein RadC